MTIIYGTGFEAGSKEIVPSADAFDIGTISITAAGFEVNTGVYALKISDGGGGLNWIRLGDFSTSYTELYASIWLYQEGTTKGWGVEMELTDGTLIGVRKESGAPNQNMHAYVNGSNVQTGTATLDSGAYALVELYVKIGASGQIVAKYNNASDINYAGNTKPTSATDIQYLRVSMYDGVGDFYSIDDITVRTDTWPSDIRYINLVPDGDSAVTWTPSVGITNYNLVDEIPPNDTDYVSTATNANQDLYTLTDYSISNIISHLVQWVRGFTTPAGGEITIQVKSGTTTSGETSSGLGTAAEYIHRIVENDPDTSLAWSRTGLNAALVGQTAVVTTETVTVTQHVTEIGFTQSSSLLRPLGLDVDLESGSRVWVTAWDDGTIYLKRYSSDLSSQTSFSFGSATEAEIDARTYYLSPYCPAFFGTASLNDIIYVYGRYNDGTVRHVAKSTNGGTTFSDIGDSATWLTGWVGGFLADDANTLYALVNGASRALYRSLNAGATWTSLSSLPFDVDPGSVSKHPDGRILIANRIAGAQMVAYADSAYASWTNATGSPAFPTAGGGARSIIWVV